jgi:hypothetical protein
VRGQAIADAVIMADRPKVTIHPKGETPHAPTPSESIVRAANKTGTATDVHGRMITFKKLGALDRLRLFEIIGGANSENRMYLGHAALAACVIAINGEPEGFPATKLQLEHMMGRLDDEGLEAVAGAYAKQFGIETGETGDPDVIKN